MEELLKQLWNAPASEITDVLKVIASAYLVYLAIIAVVGGGIFFFAARFIFRVHRQVNSDIRPPRFRGLAGRRR